MIRYMVKNNLKLMCRNTLCLVLMFLVPLGVIAALSSAFSQLMSSAYDQKAIESQYEQVIQAFLPDKNHPSRMAILCQTARSSFLSRNWISCLPSVLLTTMGSLRLFILTGAACFLQQDFCQRKRKARSGSGYTPPDCPLCRPILES